MTKSGKTNGRFVLKTDTDSAHLGQRACPKCESSLPTLGTLLAPKQVYNGTEIGCLCSPDFVTQKTLIL